MDPQIAHNFLKYQPEYEQFRTKFLKPKSLSAIKSTPAKQMQLQFQILSSVDVPDNIFNLQNKKMNRYIDIHAYEHSRVKIPHINNYYINANQVKSLVDNKVYAIFSQAPVKNYDNFWQAVYYKNVSVVIMLCSFYDPKRGHQAEQYWPNTDNHATFSAQKLKVTNTKRNQSDQQYIVNQFSIDGPEGVKTLLHLHWMGWSDLRKPVQSNMKRFEQLLQISLQQIQQNKLIWIHCSAGIGRTGTLGGIIEAIRLWKIKKQLSIFAIVQNMRKYRYHAVQTEQQYRFLYQYLSKKLQE